MAVREKRVVQEVLVCDSCETDIVDSTGTHITGDATGYMKKEGFEFDLCVDCAAKIGLKRRGRKPAADNAEAITPDGDAGNQATPAPKKRGRPRKNPLPETTPEPQLQTVGAGRVEEW